MTQNYLDTQKASEYLGGLLKPGTLNKLRSIGGGPAFVRIGRRIAYRPADLDSFAKSYLSTSQYNR